MKTLLKHAKTLLIALLCVCICSSTVFADGSVTHFDDGHTTVEFDKYEFSVDFPSEWFMQTVEDDLFNVFPRQDSLDTYFIFTFSDYPDKYNILDEEDLFLQTTAETVVNAKAEKVEHSEIKDLHKGVRIAYASGLTDEEFVISACIHFSNYILSLTLIEPHDITDKEFPKDLIKILDSVKEL